MQCVYCVLWGGHAEERCKGKGYGCQVSGFSGMGIVEWWNSGMVQRWNGFFFSSILFACLSSNYYSMALFLVCLLLFSGNLVFACVCVFVANFNSTTL